MTNGLKKFTAIMLFIATITFISGCNFDNSVHENVNKTQKVQPSKKEILLSLATNLGLKFETEMTVEAIAAEIVVRQNQVWYADALNIDYMNYATNEELDDAINTRSKYVELAQIYKIDNPKEHTNNELEFFINIADSKYGVYQELLNIKITNEGQEELDEARAQVNTVEYEFNVLKEMAADFSDDEEYLNYSLNNKNINALKSYVYATLDDDIIPGMNENSYVIKGANNQDIRSYCHTISFSNLKLIIEDYNNSLVTNQEQLLFGSNNNGYDYNLDLTLN